MLTSICRLTSFRLCHNQRILSKMEKTKREKKIKNEATQKKEINKQSAIFVNDEGLIGLRIHAKPGAKKSSVVEINEEEIEISIGAAPREGAANEELISYLLSALSLRKNEIHFDKGAKSRTKVVLISSNRVTIDDVRRKLQDEIDS